jgi:hypothetical protein
VTRLRRRSSIYPLLWCIRGGFVDGMKKPHAEGS